MWQWAAKQAAFCPRDNYFGDPVFEKRRVAAVQQMPRFVQEIEQANTNLKRGG